MLRYGLEKKKKILPNVLYCTVRVCWFGLVKKNWDVSAKYEFGGETENVAQHCTLEVEVWYTVL